MMKQYVRIKKEYQGCLLLYRMGDFYELFLEDASIGSRVLNITLTSRAKGKDGRIPMAGVPYHALDNYLPKLVKAGYKVAICEQMSLPNKYGIIEREVVRIVTPGTVLDEKALGKKENNYIISLAFKEKLFAITVADISTGYFATQEVLTDDINQTLADELSRIHPKECILPEKLYNDPQLLRIVKAEKNINISPFHEWDTYAHDAGKVLKRHFGVATLASFDIQDKKLAQQTAAALLGYLQQTQKGPVKHIKKITNISSNQAVALDRSTILNLELFSTIREHDAKGTLLSVLDQTITPMGGRLLKQWIVKPLVAKEEIEKRHDAVQAFLSARTKRGLLRENIQGVSDIERILSRLSVGLGNARDLINLKESLKVILEVKKELGDIDAEIVREIMENIKTKSNVILAELSSADAVPRISQKNDAPTLAILDAARMTENNTIEDIISLIETNIAPEPPISLREGRLIQTGVNAKLDKLRKIVGGSRDWILELERKERETTGIASLKVRFNQVFGFYIEVSKANLHLVPSAYMRKQTLVNAERFITPELKEQEEIVLSAEQTINEIEYNIFQDVLKKVLEEVATIQAAAQSIAVLDCLLNFAHIAEKQNYIRPKILYSGEMRIKGGRHPVVETLLEEKQFVPNDVTLDNTNQQLLLITGPNMAGKSVLMRQVALIILMSQMGSFVPADQAHISLVDRIFVRSGASDVITSGLSTFMVEMVETAHILHHATHNSLIIMDEIGRGTSTYDGISIAWAVAEYLVSNKKSPKTLFATHYHELQKLEEKYPKQIKNYHMAVAHDPQADEPIFLHTLMPEPASHSFGIAVAKLAGIPEEVITRAKELLEEFESTRKNVSDSGRGQNDEKNLQISLANRILHKELENLDIHHMTPIEALNKLSELKDKLKLFEIDSWFAARNDKI